MIRRPLDQLLPPVLDACCGSRMFWFLKPNTETATKEKA